MWIMPPYRFISCIIVYFKGLFSFGAVGRGGFPSEMFEMWTISGVQRVTVLSMSTPTHTILQTVCIIIYILYIINKHHTCILGGNSTIGAL